MSDEHKFSLDPINVPKIRTAYRQIVTEIPAPGTKEIMERISRVESSNALDQLPVIWDKAAGCQIYDPWGNCWIDLTSTIFVANCGHGHPHMVSALHEGIEKLLHSYSYPTEIRARYIERLIRSTPKNLDKLSLFSTGTEASERAIKLARYHGMRSETRRSVIVGWDGNYHGKTMGAQMAGGYHGQKEWIGYLDPNMHHLPFPYPWVMEESGLSGRELFAQHLSSLEKNGVELDLIAGFMVESFQGWGAIFYPEDYIKALREWTNQNDVLLIFDEIQSGFGRTGKLFAYEHYEVEADLVVCGKGISGSVPLSAVIGRGDVIDLDPAYTSTHGGHPLACVAGLANLEIFEKEKLVDEAARKEKLVRSHIQEWEELLPSRVGRVLGKGLVWGVFLEYPNSPDMLDTLFCDKVIERCLQKGVFSIRTGRGTIKLGPPLNIPDDALSEALIVIGESLAEIDREL